MKEAGEMSFKFNVDIRLRTAQLAVTNTEAAELQLTEKVR